MLTDLRFHVRPFRGVLFSLASLGAVALAHATQVSGSVGAVDTTGAFVQVNFTCSLAGTTCSGIAQVTERDTGCSNTLSLSEPITVVNLDLSHPGPIAATVNVTGAQSMSNPLPGGTCAYTVQGTTQHSLPLSGNWDGVRATISVIGQSDGQPFTLTGTLTADTPVGTPVFPMTVTGSVDANAANIQAEIQFRPQDVGTNPNVYVFAVAPSNRVLGAKAALATGIAAKGMPKDTPIQCVIAQLNASGQLVGVSASGLQAYVNGVVTSQGAAVTVLNNVPTSSVAGATFFVGYGPDATTMYNSGVNRSAVTVPGEVQCKPEAPQTGWWWNPQEDGRGYSIEVRANHYFMAAFLYDASGRASWYVSTGDGATLDGSLIAGRLLSARGGQTLGGPYPGVPALHDEGAVTMAFNDASHGTLVWAGGSVPIQRFNIVTNGLTLAPLANQPETGWWWNPNESGRGFFMEWQGGVLDIAGYLYDDQGNPIWYLTENPTTSTNLQQFSGNWWQFAGGMTLMGPWKQNHMVSDHVAPVTITFQGADSAIMTLPNGRTTSLVRHRF